MEKAIFSRKNPLLTSKLDLNSRNKLIKCYVWSIALYGAETWKLPKADQKYPGILKCDAGEGWRSVRSIFRYTKEYYTESRTRRMS
jgi:hypothetical protein